MKQKKKTEDPQQATVTDTVDEKIVSADEPADQAGEERSDPGASSQTDPAENTLQAAYDALSDKHLRLMAEYDNFRRRTREEKLDLYDRSVADVLKDWLPVFDNLCRALQTETDDQAHQGIELIHRQALQIMEKYEIDIVGEVGDVFDPNLHEAVMHIDDDQYGVQEIVEVFEKGYCRKGQVLRHAVVKVAN